MHSRVLRELRCRLGYRSDPSKCDTYNESHGCPWSTGTFWEVSALLLDLWQALKLGNVGSWRVVTNHVSTPYLFGHGPKPHLPPSRGHLGTSPGRARKLCSPLGASKPRRQKRDFFTFLYFYTIFDVPCQCAYLVFLPCLLQTKCSARLP